MRRLHIVLTVLFISIINFSAAQNVGIGITTPTEKLEVKNALRSTVKVSSANFDDTTELILSNRAGTFGTDFSLKSIREEGLFLSSNSDLPGNISPYSMVVKPNGNIGMGTFQPAYKLHLHNSASTTTLMTITNSSTGADISDGLFVGMNGVNATVANLENGNLTLGTNNLTRMTINSSGDVGIGIAPTAKLDINGGVKLEGLNLFEFGAGVAGKEVNAGKVGYNAFGQDGLVFVGGGTDASNREVYFFAEGGTTMSGSLNIGGTMQVNGNPGTAGQVLSSNGSSDPTWEDMAYTNNTRFAVNLSTTTAGAGFMSITSTIYNLNAINITISGNTITINKTGLYRINGVIDGGVGYLATPPAWEPEISAALVLSGAVSRTFRLSYFDHFKQRNSVGNPNYYYLYHFSIDMYIPAGTDIDVSKEFYWDGTPSAPSASMRLYGNLIAD